MENIIWEGKASWKSAIGVLDIILALFTLGFWLIVPAIKMISLNKTKYKVTTQRIVIKEGIASTSSSEIELYRVKDLSVTQTFMQKILNIGDITIKSAGMQNTNLEMKAIPNPEQLREQIRASVGTTRKDNNIRLNESI
ncbi:MAG TPA: hypothetical protein DEB42_00460 [Jeotgalicoccus sp.]|nr:hypothetical protein [Jeotgalicoccus sp.]